MTWIEPPDFTTGSVLTETNLDILSNDLRVLTTLQSYTPTVTQGGAVAKTVPYCKYHQAGKKVYVQMKLAITGSGSAGSVITISLPVTASTTGLDIGHGRVKDASGPTTYSVNAQISTTTVINLWRQDQNFTDFVGADPNFGLANGDEIGLTFQYEAA